VRITGALAYDLTGIPAAVPMALKQ
jgi:hypothetical protein